HDERVISLMRVDDLDAHPALGPGLLQQTGDLESADAQGAGNLDLALLRQIVPACDGDRQSRVVSITDRVHTTSLSCARSTLSCRQSVDSSGRMGSYSTECSREHITA